jgi:spore maturation protein CgeB
VPVSPEKSDKIQYFLSHPDEWDRIALAGYVRTAGEHTYEKRLEVINFAVAAKARSPRVRAPDFVQVIARHRLSLGLRVGRRGFEGAGRFLFGVEKGRKAARRLAFELSWRLAGRSTFTSKGWSGRMFLDC